MYDQLRQVVVIKSPFHTFPVSFRLSQLSWPSSLAGRPMPTCPGSIPTWNGKTVDWNVDSRLSLEVRVHHVDIGHSVLKEFCRHLVCMGMGVWQHEVWESDTHHELEGAEDHQDCTPLVPDRKVPVGEGCLMNIHDSLAL